MPAIWEPSASPACPAAEEELVLWFQLHHFLFCNRPGLFSGWTAARLLELEVDSRLLALHFKPKHPLLREK